MYYFVKSVLGYFYYIALILTSINYDHISKKLSLIKIVENLRDVPNFFIIPFNDDFIYLYYWLILKD